MVTLHKKFILGVLTLCSVSLFAADANSGWFEKDEHKDANKTGTWSEKMREDDDHAKMRMHDTDPAAIRVDGSEALGVKIDIEPAEEGNLVNLSQKGALEAAILGSADFKIDDVDRTTVMLEGTENNGIFRVEDVNKDGMNDLIATFDVDALSLDEGTKMLKLEGKTLNGQSFTGSDSVNVAASDIPATQPTFEQ
jgi:DNA-directed RNA polymerase alpha subunit